MSRQNHWSALADNFQNLGAPLRPCQEDIAIMDRALTRWQAESRTGALQALSCGVTPELTRLCWPPGSFLRAVERSANMIRRVWPGDVPGKQRALRGNWLALPFSDASCHVIVGDGFFNCVDFPGGYRELAASLRRVITTGGLLITRVFVQPESKESPERVLQDLQAGRIRSFHAFKFRFAMALQPDSCSGIVVKDVFRAWAAAGIDPEDLAFKTGWRPEEIGTINLWNGQGTHLSFPTLAEIQEVLAERFEGVSVHWPTYELGERCPIVTFRAS